MQQGFHAYHAHPGLPRAPKHGFDEVDDGDEDSIQQASGKRTAIDGARAPNVKFSDGNLKAAAAFVADAKRRKGNSGSITLPIDLEPQFGGLSLGRSVSQQPGGTSGQHITSSSRSPASGPAGDSVQRSRLSSTTTRDSPSPPNSIERVRGRFSRGEREVTPFPSDGANGSPSTVHRKRSSSRNRARHTASSGDATMAPAPRYDPSRPHVVFVDSLSDSEDEDENEPDSEGSLAVLGGQSSTSTPGNSPNSSDNEDAVMPPSSSSARPIQMNKRLRDHLHKQHVLKNLSNTPVGEDLLTSASPTTGGAGIHERGLVLYRPLSWGIVEEPEEDEAQAETAASNDLHIQEISDPRYLEDSGTRNSMDVDTDMDLDE